MELCRRWIHGSTATLVFGRGSPAVNVLQLTSRCDTSKTLSLESSEDLSTFGEPRPYIQIEDCTTLDRRSVKSHARNLVTSEIAWRSVPTRFPGKNRGSLHRKWKECVTAEKEIRREVEKKGEVQEDPNQSPRRVERAAPP